MKVLIAIFWGLLIVSCNSTNNNSTKIETDENGDVVNKRYLNYNIQSLKFIIMKKTSVSFLFPKNIECGIWENHIY